MDDHETTADIDDMSEEKGFSFMKFVLGALTGAAISVTAIGVLSLEHTPDQADKLDNNAESARSEADFTAEVAPEVKPDAPDLASNDGSELEESTTQEQPPLPLEPAAPVAEGAATLEPPIDGEAVSETVSDDPESVEAPAIEESSIKSATEPAPELETETETETETEKAISKPEALEAEISLGKVPESEAPRSELPVAGDPIIIETDQPDTPPIEEAVDPVAEEPTPVTEPTPVKRAPKRNSAELEIALDKDDPNRLAFKVPKRREKDTAPAWERNAIAFDVPEDMPLIAVILEAPNDSSIPEDLLLDLSLPLTMSVVPRSSADAAFGASARAAGFEVMARLPVQDRVNRDGSNERIHVGMSESQAREMTRRFLARMPVAVGATSFGSRAASQNTPLMSAVISELGVGGYAFIDDSDRPNSIGPKLAQATGALFAETDRRITADLSDTQVYSLLESAALEAANGEMVILSVETDRGALIGIQRWALERNGKTARLAPLTAVLGRR